MEEMRLVADQPLVKEGEKPGYFFKVKSGRLKSDSVVYSPGDLLGFMEFFTSSPFESDVVAEEDSVVWKLDLEDLENDEIFDEVLSQLLIMYSGLLGESPGGEVIEDLKRSADIASMAQVVESSGEESALEAIEELLTLQELPDIPENEREALELIEKLEKEEDLLRLSLHMVAFAKKFPRSTNTPEILMKAAELYSEKLNDRYNARYALKLLFLFQPNSDLLKQALRKLIKLLREDRDPEWFEYLERFILHFPGEEVNIDEVDRSSHGEHNRGTR